MNCSPTGMFALPNLMSHVSSAAFALARLRPGSGLLRSAHPTSTSHQKSSTFNEGPQRKPLRLVRGTNFITIIHPQIVIPSAYLHLKCKNAKILFASGLTLSFESSSFTTASCPFSAVNDNGVRRYSLSLESRSVPFSVSSSFLCSGQAAPPPEACVLCHGAKKQVSWIDQDA
jgi:hypothetical protein